jgi:hypothetical protein
MPTARPISALRPSILAMADAAQKANIQVIRGATKDLEVAVDTRGRRFRLRGRDGRRYPLEARSDVKLFGDASKPVGMVKGIPAGFWAIVEEGSYRHIIYSRRGRNGAVRITRSGKEASAFMTRGRVMRRQAGGESLGALQPLRTPYGPRQYVMHPGHAPIGTPWQASMRLAPELVRDSLAYHQFNAQFRAFTNTIT